MCMAMATKLLKISWYVYYISLGFTKEYKKKKNETSGLDFRRRKKIEAEQSLMEKFKQNL